MRDPRRIHSFMVELEALWKETPDLRFGQLISNLFGDLSLFYTEDDTVFAWIERQED